MKILVVCDQGNNRSVTLAGQLKYLGHDVLTCGLDTNTLETVDLLVHWADKVIKTAGDQLVAYRDETDGDKFELWDIGPDRYPRPYNKDLLKICRRLIDQHPEIRQ